MAEPVIDGYEDFVLIGTGGFSRVYRAKQDRLERMVAIKVLNFGLNTETERRDFLREAETLGRVSTHPNIVSVYDTEFTSQGNPCIVMENYPGGSLGDLVNEIGCLSVQATLEVGVAIASALAASHRAGVVHCDLKPHNVLISEFGQPVLGDFGISTLVEEHTQTGDGVAFTLSFAAPEIVEGESPSIATDVYSLAATLYTTLAGETPFGFVTTENKKPTTSERARRIVLEEPAPLMPFGVPHEIDTLIQRGLAKDPSARPQSAAEFAALLHEVGQRLGYGTSRPRTSERGALPVLDTGVLNLNDMEFTQTGAVPAQTPPAAGTTEAALLAASPSIDQNRSTQDSAAQNSAAPDAYGVALGHAAQGSHAADTVLAAPGENGIGTTGQRNRAGIAFGAVLAVVVAVVALWLLVAGRDSASPVSTSPEPTAAQATPNTTVTQPTATSPATTAPQPTTAATELTPAPAPAKSPPPLVPTTPRVVAATNEPIIEVEQADNACSAIGCVLDITVTGFPPGEEVLIDVFERGGETERVWFVPIVVDAQGVGTTSQPFLYTTGTFDFDAFVAAGYPTEPLASTMIELG